MVNMRTRENRYLKRKGQQEERVKSGQDKHKHKEEKGWHFETRKKETDHHDFYKRVTRTQKTKRVRTEKSIFAIVDWY